MEAKNKKTFLEAFVFTLIVFVFGILIGMTMENKNLNAMNEAYMNSQVTMFDTYLASTLINSNDSCEFVKEQSIELANKIYSEAELLDTYDDFSEIYNDLTIVHKKYDVLRTMLWSISSQKLGNCSNYNIVVYLYDYGTEDLTQQAYQNTWSRFLGEFKEKMGDNIILIPIAANQESFSLDILLQNFNIERYPAVIVNNKDIFYEVPKMDEFEGYLN